jgi:hypothetical protein
MGDVTIASRRFIRDRSQIRFQREQERWRSADTSVYINLAILEYHAYCDGRKMSKLRVINKGEEFDPPLRQIMALR